jgi:hypothetical protein
MKLKPIYLQTSQGENNITGKLKQFAPESELTTINSNEMIKIVRAK